MVSRRVGVVTDLEVQVRRAKVGARGKGGKRGAGKRCQTLRAASRVLTMMNPCHQRRCPLRSPGFTPTVETLSRWDLIGHYPAHISSESLLWQEHNDGAECMMAGVSFYDDDTPVNRQLKLTMLRIYNSRVRSGHLTRTTGRQPTPHY